MKSDHGFGWSSDLGPYPMNGCPEDEAYDIRHDGGWQIEATDEDAEQDRNAQ